MHVNSDEIYAAPTPRPAGMLRAGGSAWAGGEEVAEGSDAAPSPSALLTSNVSFFVSPAAAASSRGV